MTDTLAVLVPVLGRPQNVASLVESFARGCPEDALLVVLTTSGDQATFDEWGQYIDMAPQDFALDKSQCRTWPQKINHGVEIVEANQPVDWYLFAADDIRFTQGWWDATRRLRENPTVGVIGTNDSRDGTGNPRVTAGEHTCHPLVSRDYITTHGTIDEPGVAVHDGYHHWCVDDELIWTAKVRGAWAYCPDAIVEHLHPYWGTAPVDATYQLGESHVAEDMDLWRQRMKLLGLSPA